MPLSPSTWITNNPITAHQLNADLYSYDGSLGYFAANGVMFHANKPLLIESYAVTQSIAAPKGGQFTVLGGAAGNAISILDNAALYGSGSDRPADSATFRSNGAVAPGSSGVAGQYGGWNLAVGFVPLGPFSGAGSAFGAAWYLGGSALQDIGPIQPASTGYDNCGFAVDLVNRAGVTQGQLAVAAWACDPNARAATVKSNTVSTVGETPRFTELWLGVNNGNGKLVSGIPSPLTAVTGTTQLSSGTLNTTIQQTFNLLNYPPMLNIQGDTGLFINVPNSPTVMTWNNTPLIDSYSAFNASDATHYIVPLSGIYFCHCTAVLAIGGSPLTQFAAGLTVNGTNYFGGWYNYGSLASQNYGAAVTRVLDLNKGDTVSTFVASSAANEFSYTGPTSSHWIMAWMSPAVTATQSWTPPEVTGFQFAAATPPGTGTGQLANIMNTKIANDINFLLNKPYLLARQTAQQTGLAVNSKVSITMNTVSGLVHGSNGDSYAGWSAANNWYAAPVSGWYLAIAEISAATQATVTGNQLLACLNVPSSGGVSSPGSPQGQPDIYQMLPVASAGTWPTGATAIGCYYLNAGEHIAPYAQYSSGTATTWSTDVSHGFQSHFECFWVSA